jgi:hypothetical protein
LLNEEATLAQAMYYKAKEINKDFLSGRTIGGLDAELQGHWAAYKTLKRIPFANEVIQDYIIAASRADMGTIIEGKDDYDSNARLWESAEGVRTIKQLLSGPVGGIYLFKDLLRYFS